MSTDLRQRLRHDTRAAHDRLDRRLDLTGAVSRPAYIRLLQRFHALHAALEPSLQRHLPARLTAGRGKLAALDHDLACCEANTAGRVLPPPLPAIDDHASALGAFYVVEGSTLGGQIISRALRDNPQIPLAAHRYLTVYGNHTGERWRAVCAALSDITDETMAIRIIGTATELFETLAAWLPDGGP